MNESLANLGLSTFFTQQLSLEEIEHNQLARVIEVQRSGFVVSSGDDDHFIQIGAEWLHLPVELRPTVGDWVLLDEVCEKITRLLERKSVFKRVAAGIKVDVQLIAANIDTLFIVTSCNDDFNESRLERHLALAVEAGVDPVIVITKSDLSNDPESFRCRALKVKTDLAVELVNVHDAQSLSVVNRWISTGTTVALVGSSGVGKSSIVNALIGEKVTKTSGIREQDSKGRHTTSYRALHELQSGGVLLDVPGIRELKVAQIEESLDEVFSDIDTLSQQCKFNDCAHKEEPGCAVRQAIADGKLENRRLISYQKLVEEDRRNNASLAEKRHADRQFGKMIKQKLP